MRRVARTLPHATGIAPHLQRDPRVKLRRKPLIVRALQRYWRMTRGLTLGVCACVIDRSNHVLFLKSPDGLGWRLPITIVRRGETLAGALTRSLRDDVGIAVSGNPSLCGMYSERAGGAEPGVGQIGLYAVRHWQQTERFSHSQATSFPADALPPALSPATRACIELALKGRAASEVC